MRRGPRHGEAITTIQNPFLICTARVWLYPPLATSGDRTSVSLGISCRSTAKIPPSLLKISAPDAESPRPRSNPLAQHPGLLRWPQKNPNPRVFNQFSPCPAGNAPSGLSPWCCPFPEPDVAQNKPPRGPTRHPQLEISHGTPISALLSGTQFFFLIYFYLPPGRREEAHTGKKLLNLQHQGIILERTPQRALTRRSSSHGCLHLFLQ